MAITKASYADGVKPEILERVASAPVYFGHQSVGRDVLAGLRLLMGRRVLGWREEGLERSGDSLAKIDAFQHSILSGAGRSAGLALVELCRVDLDHGCDTSDLFDRYERVMNRLARARPETRFVHVTIPLALGATGARRWVRRDLRAVALPEGGNVYRHSFNEFLRETFRGCPIFDIAQIQAGLVDARPAPSRAPWFTDDGSHLTFCGRLAVAAALADMVGNLVGDARRLAESGRGGTVDAT